MDRISWNFGQGETMRPEILLAYGLFAVFVTISVNWALTTLLIMLKPFTCAAILLAFIRPDLAHTFFQEDYLRETTEKTKMVKTFSVSSHED